MAELSTEIAELLAVHKGLKMTQQNGSGEVALKGTLLFVAKPKRFASITISFEVSMCITGKYPDDLPRITETGGKIDNDYEHVFTNGTLCLGVPVEMRMIFSQEPTLLGFVNRLVVPYLYGYCYWKKYSVHPFGELKPGGEGIVQYYKEKLSLVDESTALACIQFLAEHGYRRHERCPCGSGRKVLKCHGTTLRDLHLHHTPTTLDQELQLTNEYWLAKHTDDDLLLQKKNSSHFLKLADGSKL